MVRRKSPCAHQPPEEGPRAFCRVWCRAGVSKKACLKAFYHRRWRGCEIAVPGGLRYDETVLKAMTRQGGTLGLLYRYPYLCHTMPR